MKVLLTGATGFIGSYILAELLDRKIETAVLIRQHSDPWRIKTYLNKCHILEGDLNNPNQLKNLIHQFAPQKLIHAAWHGVSSCQRNELAQIDLNIANTINLFNAVAVNKIDTIIGLGSQAEYGLYNSIINESMLTNPSTLYGTAKLAAGHMLRVLCQQSNIRFLWHRIFSSYGPKDQPDWLIPMLINKFQHGEIPKTTAGTQYWDYLFVKDIAKAIVLSMLHENAQGIFNIGSGQTIQIRQLIEMIRDKINPSVNIDFDGTPFRDDQIMFLQADISKITKTLNWVPETGLNEGLNVTLAWHEEKKKNVIC